MLNLVVGLLVREELGSFSDLCGRWRRGPVGGLVASGIKP